MSLQTGHKCLRLGHNFFAALAAAKSEHPIGSDDRYLGGKVRDTSHRLLCNLTFDIGHQVNSRIAIFFRHAMRVVVYLGPLLEQRLPQRRHKIAANLAQYPAQETVGFAEMWQFAFFNKLL